MNSLTKIALIYFITLLCAGVFFLIREIVNGKKLPHHVPTSKMSWTDFGFLIWSLIILTFFVQTAWSLIPTILPNPWPHVTLGFSIQLAMLSFIIISALWFPKLFDFPVNSKTSPPHPIKQGFLSFIIALPIVWLVNLSWIGVTQIWNNFGFVISLQEQELVKLFSQSKSPLLLILIVIFGVIIAPITEEIIFRAGIYRFLKSKMHELIALTISALLFAWIHNNLLSFLPLFLLGLLLARSYEKTGNIITPIIFHSLFNANSLIILLLDPQFQVI